jgi:hypothetical protein
VALGLAASGPKPPLCPSGKDEVRGGVALGLAASGPKPPLCPSGKDEVLGGVVRGLGAKPPRRKHDGVLGAWRW